MGLRYIKILKGVQSSKAFNAHIYLIPNGLRGRQVQYLRSQKSNPNCINLGTVAGFV
jgi:hypothetical protein